MNLQELQENKKTVIVKRALREHYEIEMDFDRLSLSQAQKMLGKVKGLIKESRSKAGITSHENSAYLKLIMMEQALSDRLSDLRNPNTRVVVENEEVQKSQVILAAQDMIDNLQKMLEQVSKMNVEELTAVVDGMKNEFGTAEGDGFNQAVSEALTTLQSALTTTKNSLTSALGSVTGEGAAPASGMDMGLEPGADMGAPEMPGGDLGGGMDADMDTDMGDEEPLEEPEPEDIGGAGRERR